MTWLEDLLGIDPPLTRSDWITIIVGVIGLLAIVMPWVWKRWIVPWRASRTQAKAVAYLERLEKEERSLSFVFLDDELRQENMLEALGRGLYFLVLLGLSIAVLVVASSWMTDRFLARVVMLVMLSILLTTYISRYSEDLLTFPSKLGLQTRINRLRRQIAKVREKPGMPKEPASQAPIRREVDKEVKQDSDDLFERIAARVLFKKKKLEEQDRKEIEEAERMLQTEAAKPKANPPQNF